MIATGGMKVNSAAHISSRVEYFDYLRALAIIPVVLHHFNSKYMPGGGLGVNIFFCLSGYFITVLLLRDMPPFAKYAGFVIRRMFRILPLYFLIVTLNLYMLQAYQPEYFATASEAVARLYALAGRPQWSGVGIGVMWTLHVEFWFYLTFPLLFILAPKGVGKILFLTFVALSSIMISSDKFLSASIWGFAIPPIRDLIYFANNFAFGGLAAIFINRGFEFRRVLFPYVLIIASVFVVIWCFGTVERRHLSPELFRAYGSLTAAATAILILCFSSDLGKRIYVPGVAWIGLISYSLYLVHAVVIDHFSSISTLGQELNNISPMLMISRASGFREYIEFFVICFLFSFLTYRAVEKPSMWVGRSLAKRTEDWFLKMGLEARLLSVVKARMK